MLINSLGQLNRDVVEIEELLVGGENDDWPVEQHPDSLFPLEDDADGDQELEADPEEDEQGFGGQGPADGGGSRPDPRRGNGISSFDGRVP